MCLYPNRDPASRCCTEVVRVWGWMRKFVRVYVTHEELVCFMEISHSLRFNVEFELKKNMTSKSYWTKMVVVVMIMSQQLHF